MQVLTSSSSEFAVPAAASRLGDVLSVRVEDARRLDAGEFSSQVTNAFRQIADRLDGRHLVRMWNGIPGIHDRLGERGEIDRYMAFNAGRYAAMRDWYAGDIAHHAPAASGVGIDGDDLIIHALVAREPGIVIQNPRQIPAALYSSHYGPLPPCFARATRIGDTLLVAGTAAIVGETSTHVGDLDAQLTLTLDHLRTVVETAGLASRASALDAYTSLRVYLPDEASRRIGGELSLAFPNAGAIEWVRAQLCRRELLIEIEGITGKAP